MAPPHDLVRERKRLRIHAREHEREQIPHRRPERPRVVRAHDAQPFSGETRKQDQQQKHKPHDIDRVSFEMLVGARDTAHESDDDADRAHEARKIDTEREEIQIERAVQDGDAKMVLKCRERRSNEQEQHAPEDEQVHDAG